MNAIERLAEYRQRYTETAIGSIERSQIIAEFVRWNWAGREPFNAYPIAQMILERS